MNQENKELALSKMLEEMNETRLKIQLFYEQEDDLCSRIKEDRSIKGSLMYAASLLKIEVLDTSLWMG